jgi:hypothetical protein
MCAMILLFGGRGVDLAQSHAGFGCGILSSGRAAPP